MTTSRPTEVVIGLLLTPPTLVKMGSTGWRIARYYQGDPRYKTSGAPPIASRILGPILVAPALACGCNAA